MPPAPKAATAVRRPAAIGAMTVDETRRAWAARFRDGGVDTPELDARILICRALGLDHAGLAAAAAHRLTAAEDGAIAVLARRRLGREPVARILGVKEFWSLALALNAATLVPRPETETVVETVLAAVDRDGPRSRPLRIADLGTGSGALLLALLTELPKAVGVGTDVSADALAIARGNAQQHGLSRRAGFVACDLAAALKGSFDVVVSNPPYIAAADIAGLAPEVRLFDPRRALDGGADGLDFYRTIAAAAPALLAGEGVLAVELGAGQSDRVAALFAAAGLALSPPRADLNGVPRVLVARKLQRNRKVSAKPA
ncbi:MAG TPA: peptide chain release factor N(5)-glutamine methyltransferase [Xanthobacteraceae bacterium]|nr:peptide chain release factor N(5)-glutamine methyltransferase [Xanthobacteraceae bacterium]